MEVTRARFGSLVEWALAAACTLALAIGAALLFQAVRATSRTIVPVNAAEFAGASVATPDPPAVVPARAVSVPFIILSDGSELRIGEVESAIASKIKSAWKIGTDAVERTVAGNRLTRVYDDGLREFLLVFDPSQNTTELKLSAIYLP